MIGELVANGISLDLTTGVPFPFTYRIADAKDPNTRKRSFSRTIQLPWTQNNMDFFYSAYSLPLSTVEGTSLAGFNFDPTQRIPATYSNNGVVEFEGLLKLNECVIGKYFECTLFSNYVEIIQALGDIKVSELGWSEYNHALTRTNVKNSWNTSVKVNGVDTSNFSGGNPMGFGYHYGLVDYGFARPAPKTFRTGDLLPMIYYREIIEKCLELSGTTFTSTFLNSTRCKKILFAPGGGEKQIISPQEAANRRVRFTGSYSNTVNRNVSTINNNGGLYSFNYGALQSTIDTDTGFSGVSVTNDLYAQYEQTAGVVTIEKTGSYKLAITQVLDFALSAGAMTYVQGGLNAFLSIFRNGSLVASIGNLQNFNSNQTMTVNSSTALSLNAGDTLELRLQLFGTIRYTAGVNGYETVSVAITDSTNLIFDLTSTQNTLNDGDTVELSRFIPDMKAADAFRAFVMMFNLYVSDPDVENNVKIEPLSDFYQPTNVFVDWTQKMDNSQDVIVLPASTIEGKRYAFKWAEDNDYDNKRYRDKYNVGYGDYTYEVESTWQTGERVYQLPFAQSIPTDALLPIIMPRIVSVDDTTNIVKPYKGKPRVYMWNGLKSGAWKLSDINSGGSENLSTYPAVHHFENFESPTFDLNWGLPQELFYVTGNTTNANLFMLYHRTFVLEMTGRDSKILQAFFKLDSRDINTLDFSKLIMINDVLYRLNEIKDFDSSTGKTTFVELIKIVEARKPKTFTTLSGVKQTKKDTVTIKQPTYTSEGAVIFNTGVSADAAIIRG